MTRRGKPDGGKKRGSKPSSEGARARKGPPAASQPGGNFMPGGERLLERLRAGGLTLLVEREGRLVHASDRGGLRPLYEGIIAHPQLFESADVADRVVGLAAAYLLVHARVARVATPLISKEAERALAEAGIPFAAQSRVKNLEDVPLPEGIGTEQLARDSVTPATFVEALRTRFG